MKSKELLDSFNKYCNEHKEERFWQALRNWSGYSFIFGTKKDTVWAKDCINTTDLEDTFYKD